MIIELLWRGRTHWTMGLCAGVCFVQLYLLEKYMSNLKLITKCIIGTTIITLNEFITGCIVNLSLGWAVWDYSETPLNLFGQVCLVFSLLWFILCIPTFKLARKIKGLFSAN